MVLLVTRHVAVSQKHDNLVVEERINQLEAKIMTNIKQEMTQLEERLISKLSPTLEKQETKNQVPTLEKQETKNQVNKIFY